jgi:hypothetical protein
MKYIVQSKDSWKFVLKYKSAILTIKLSTKRRISTHIIQKRNNKRKQLTIKEEIIKL